MLPRIPRDGSPGEGTPLTFIPGGFRTVAVRVPQQRFAHLVLLVVEREVISISSKSLPEYLAAAAAPIGRWKRSIGGNIIPRRRRRETGGALSTSRPPAGLNNLPADAEFPLCLVLKPAIECAQ